MTENLSLKRINIKEILGQPEGVVLEEDINIAKEMIEDSDVNIRGPISGRIKLENRKNKIIAIFNLDVLIRSKCDRCLEEFERKLKIKFTQKYSSKNENEETLPIFPDQTIDIGDPLRQELLANMPYKNLCSKECKGLCSKCGANLNKKNCKCK